jgi:hypothetical protein
MSKSLKEKLAAAKLPEKVVTLCLRGDLLASHDQLINELADARREVASSLAGADLDPILDKIEALRQEMLDDSIDLRIRAMPSRNWDALIKAHPPRPDDELDQRLGYNAYAFYRQALIDSCVEPALDESDWLDLIGDADQDGVLTDAQWDELTNTIYDLNRHRVSVPFLPSNWRETISSGLA